MSERTPLTNAAYTILALRQRAEAAEKRVAELESELHKLKGTI